MNKNSKIWTIIQHEYLTKVKSKGFIITTLLGPIFMLLIFAVPVVITILSQNSSEKKIAIIDETDKQIAQKMISHDTAKYYISNESPQALKSKVLSEQCDGYLIITKDILKTGVAKMFTRGGGGLGLITAAKSTLDNIILRERLIDIGADNSLIKTVESGVDIQTEKVTEKGTEKDFTEAYTIVGYFLGLVIYMMMFLYGSFVSRGVIEEKANRIVEVIASSVKPFEIMMGKVIGIGAVGLTQVLFWIIMMIALLLLSTPIISMFVPHDVASQVASSQMSNMNNTPFNLQGFQMPYISPWLFIGFIFYFLAGYFIYSTLFAAVGSAVDQESDAANLQLPITLPLIIPILLIGNIISNPDGTLAVVLSLFPFFTPILMIVRVSATSVPLWQIILSVVLEILTFLGCIWATARIYRVGILMYGKKVSLKDLIKWVRVSK